MSAVAELSQAPGWSSKLSTLNRTQRMRFGVGIALMVAVAIAAVVLGRTPDWRVLYTNLGDKDGGAVIAQLSTMNVPYKNSDGGAIMVPSDRVNDVRMRLASLGLPKGSVSGFELMENSRFGMTQFQEKLTFQRGLEGELTRSIQALSSVQSARVHLALPNQNGFFREQQKPSASVLVSLHPGRALDRNQLAGIVHLVASSVPELTPSAVSVLDDTGKLLSGAPENGAGDAQQLQYTQQTEQMLNRRIMDILEPIVGRDNVKAQVSADIDFTQTESTSESHKPNLSPDSSAVRSQQVVENGGGAGGPGVQNAGGVPGATSNQPPNPTTAAVTGAGQTLGTGAPGAAGAASGAGASTGRRETVTNYEVDKTIRTTRASSGAIKRLSAAIVVNYNKVADAQGKVTPTAISQAQLDQMTALVREAIGFNKDRGDSVNLMNAPFLEAQAADSVPLWKQPEMLDLARGFIWPGAMVVIGMIVFFGMVRPGMKALAVSTAASAAANAARASASGSQLDTLVSEMPERPALLPPGGGNGGGMGGGNQNGNQNSNGMVAADHLRLEHARQMARANPAAVANIVKTWVNGDAPA